MSIKAVIFDLDNTLYDERQFVESGFRAVSEYATKKHGVNEEKFYSLLLFFLKYGRKKVFDRALKKLNMYNKENVLAMVKVYRDHIPRIKVSRDDLEVLLEIRKKYRTGLITDGIKVTQKNKVEALNLQNHFDVITYAIEYGGKKDVDTFQTTLKKLDANPSETIYVDDNPLKGCLVAKELGIHTVRILRGEYRDLKVDKDFEAEFEIRDLKQIVDVIRSIANAQLDHDMR